jgi:hypothetical protein
MKMKALLFNYLQKTFDFVSLLNLKICKLENRDASAELAAQTGIYLTSCTCCVHTDKVCSHGQVKLRMNCAFTMHLIFGRYFNGPRE